MIITIDGTAGSGKSTAARKLAAKLGIAYLDTGAMYRAMALAGMDLGIDLFDADALVELVESIDLEVDCGPTYTRVRVDGRDVSEAIRSMAVSRSTSQVAKCQPVREFLVKQQRQIGAKLGSFVTEGRDQGSVVFPDADLKFVLEATPEKRAERRHQELVADGEEVAYEEVLDNLQRRDRADARHWASLLVPGAATIINTTNMTLHEVVEHLASLAASSAGR